VEFEGTSSGMVGMAQWLACMPLRFEFEPIKGSSCFLKQNTLPSLLSTGWFREHIQALFT